jgi:putative endonuclease
MFYVYILYSKTLDRFYVGQTENLDNRIFRHTNSGSKSTKAADDWELKYKEECNTRSEAVQREAEIKKKKSRKYIEWLISSAKRHIEITVKHKNY